MRLERTGHTLQATALVNEAYLRLIDVKQMKWQNRAHSLAMAARVMRRILVESARARRFQKRGGGAQVEPLDEERIAAGEPGRDLVALDDALTALASGSQEESRGRDAILRRTHRRRNGRSAARIRRDGQA
jgi:RNA polymerase sigma-70 factor (ECF subfamily)